MLFVEAPSSNLLLGSVEVLGFLWLLMLRIDTSLFTLIEMLRFNTCRNLRLITRMLIVQIVVKIKLHLTLRSRFLYF